MTVLGLECSSVHRSVAIGRDGLVAAAAGQSAGRQTTLLALVEDALSAAALPRDAIDTLAVGLGPGSYTGIRGALALAEGWKLATGARLVGVASSTACAWRCAKLGLRGRVAVVIDAQRGEFYLHDFELESEAIRPVMPLRLATRAEVCALGDAGALLVGPEVQGFGSEARVISPDASALVELAMLEPPVITDEVEPIYLRPTAFTKAPPPRNGKG